MARVKQYKQWLIYAARDLRSAELVLHGGPDQYPSAAFHAQQCAEKAIKGFLTFKRVRFQKTHLIANLSELVQAQDSDLAKIIETGSHLSEYAVTFRYPGAATKKLTLRDVKRALKLSKEIYEACLARID